MVSSARVSITYGLGALAMAIAAGAVEHSGQGRTTESILGWMVVFVGAAAVGGFLLDRANRWRGTRWRLPPGPVAVRGILGMILLAGAWWIFFIDQWTALSVRASFVGAFWGIIWFLFGDEVSRLFRYRPGEPVATSRAP